MPNSVMPGQWSGPDPRLDHQRSRIEAPSEISRESRRQWVQDATDSMIMGVLLLLVGLIAFL